MKTLLTAIVLGAFSLSAIADENGLTNNSRYHGLKIEMAALDSKLSEQLDAETRQYQLVMEIETKERLNSLLTRK